jgi:uncharacterized membrane protein YciS (DUF1049 family)
VRFLKWALFFVLSFVVSWILITTFSQYQFRTSAPILVVTYQTPAIPLYYYPVATFAIGLAIGLTVAVYNYITLRAKIFQKNKQHKQLESEVEALKKREGDLLAAQEEMQKQQEVQAVKAETSAPLGSPAVEQEDEFLDSEDDVHDAAEVAGTEETPDTEPPSDRDP